jgi:hypothetical protein
MKYLIKESQFDKMVFKYLDNQDFIVVGNSNTLFFINSEDDEKAQIRYNEYDGFCYINHDLKREISSLFSIDIPDSEKIIGKWVENVLDVEITNIGIPGGVSTNSLYL